MIPTRATATDFPATARARDRTAYAPPPNRRSAAPGCRRAATRKSERRSSSNASSADSASSVAMASLQRPSAIASAPTISSACPRTGSRSSSTSASTSDARPSTRWRRRGSTSMQQARLDVHPRPAVRDVADPGVGDVGGAARDDGLEPRGRRRALADVQVRDRRARQQRRAIAGRQRGAMAFEQRFRRLPGVVPLRAIETDGGQPFQRRPVAAVAPVRTRIQRERAIVLPGGLGGGGHGEEPLGRVRDGGAARRQPIQRVGGRLPVSGGELEARARDRASAGSSGRKLRRGLQQMHRARRIAQLVALHDRQLDQQRPLALRAGRETDLALEQLRDLRPVPFARRERAQRGDRLGQRRIERHRAPVGLAGRRAIARALPGPPASEMQRRRIARRQPRRAPSQLLRQLARPPLAFVHPFQRRDRVGVARIEIQRGERVALGVVAAATRPQQGGPPDERARTLRRRRRHPGPRGLDGEGEVAAHQRRQLGRIGERRQ